MRYIYHLTAVLFLMMTGIGVSSCKKTEYEFEKRPYNEIKQFVVIGSTGDSTKSLISGDSITIYWNPDVVMPASITPKIVIDSKATISPASGQAVPFDKNTIYTVTAEDGKVKKYHLNPVLTIPVPSISRVAGSPATWLISTQLTVYGENFLTAGITPADIKVYMQRASDGFEFPLELVENRTTNFFLTVNLPQFSAEQDTGLHKLFVKIANKVGMGSDVQLLVPPISYANPTSNLVQEGQKVYTGDTLTINYAVNDNYGGKIAGYYKGSNAIDRVLVYTSNFDIITVPAAQLKVTDNTVKLKLPDITPYIGQTINQYRFIYKTVPPDQAIYSTYYLRGFLSIATTFSAKPI